MSVRGRLPHLLVGSGLLLLAGVVTAALLLRHGERKAVSTTASTATVTAPSATTAIPPAAVEATPVSPAAVRISWRGGGRAAIALHGQPPTLWVSGGRAIVGGLSFTASYDVTTPSGTTTVQPSAPLGVTAAVAGGRLLLDGQPFFPLLLWGQCPGYEGLLTMGIGVFLNNPCGGLEAQVAALAGKGLSVAPAPGASGEGVIGSYYPDEADAHGFTGANLTSAQGVRFLTLSNHFYSAAAPLASGRGMYPGLIAKADVVGFDLYPLQNWCRRDAIPDVYDAQRELVALAAGRPTFQWIETARMDCPVDQVTAETVRAESWLAIAGGARGLGFFPIGWTGAVGGGIAQVGRDVQALGPALLAADAPVSADTPVKAGARSFGGAFYVFAINPTYKPVTATIRAQGLDGRPLQVLNENRTLTSSDGGFTDTFAPLGVHLYVAAPV